MEFYNATNGKGIVNDVLFLCDTTTASYPMVDITRNINQEYKNVARIIWEVADGWQYDDTNATDLPISTTTLVSGQADYSLPSTAQRIERIEILDNQGHWQKVEQIDISDTETPLREIYSESGLPIFYDLIGSSLMLYPAASPSYATLVNGLKVYYNRDITEFTTASTTTEPGFASPFHRILSIQAALDFENDKINLQKLAGQKSQLIDGMKKFYGHRNVERKTNISPSSRKTWRQYL
jgi:hypothetical protein